jgi:hypothetical protein
MFAKVNYSDAGGRSKSLQLRAGQRVSVGASFSADIVLGNSQGVASEHAEIFFKHKKCSIKNLSGNPLSVLLNGKPMAKAELTNEDRIEIGNNTLVFEIETPSASPAPAKVNVPATAAVATAGMALTPVPGKESATANEQQVELPVGPQFERQPNGTVLISVSNFEELVHPHLDLPESPWKYGLVCNHKLSRLKADPPEGVNYLAGLPGDIGEKNDLYYVPFDDRSDALKEFSVYAASGSGLLAINGSETADVDVAQQLKFLATWFTVPASLKFHLVNGSSLLLNKIFSLFDMLVVADIDGSHDLVIVNDPMIDSFDSFIEKIKGSTDDAGN